MRFCLLLCLLFFSFGGPLYAGEFFGFQTINVLNLKDNTKCSGVVMNTERGCYAVTNAHCVRGLAIGEENIIIAPAIAPQIATRAGQEMYAKLIHASHDHQRSFLIKAKPSSDLAQIYFDPAWAPAFCQDDFKLSEQNTPRHRHVNEVYTAQEQNQPGQVNQHLPGSMGQTHAPNPTVYYRPSQNFLLMAAGFQNDMAALLSIAAVDFDSFANLEDGMKSRLNVEYSSLPGFEFIYQVKGINLSQGMSGGPLFEIDQTQVKFKGLAASFYPFQWMSNFIPASYILEFLNNYQDDLSDVYEVSLGTQEQVAADRVSLKEEDQLLKLKEEGQIPSVVIVRKPRHQLRPTNANAPIRVPRTQVRFGDTDQDDVGGGLNLACDPVTSQSDPFFDVLPPVTNCFDLSQARFQHSGVMVKELPEKILIAYDEQQINGLTDLRALQARTDFDSTKLVTRSLGDYPAVHIRSNILRDFEGIYSEKENSAVVNQSMYQYAHLEGTFTRQYSITPSSNALIRESVIHGSELYGELFDNLFNYGIANNLNQTHDINLKLNINDQLLKLGLRLQNGQNYSFEMIPHFDQGFKKLTLNTKLVISDENFRPLTRESFTLTCDNRSFLKLICSNEKMEFGLSTSSKDASPSIRIAFWSGFKTKAQALYSKNLEMIYVFGALEKRQSIQRRVDLNVHFDNLKLKKLLANDNDQYDFVEVSSTDVLSFTGEFPQKVKQRMTGELQTKSFFYRGELFHVVYEGQKKYGVLYDRSFKVVAVIARRKLSTRAADIF